MCGFIVQEKVMQGTSKAATYRAFRQIAPKSLKLIIVFRSCCHGILRTAAACSRPYVLRPHKDWPQPIEHNLLTQLLVEQLFFLGDTRSRYELQVFAQANDAGCH